MYVGSVNVDSGQNRIGLVIYNTDATNVFDLNRFTTR